MNTDALFVGARHFLKNTVPIKETRAPTLHIHIMEANSILGNRWRPDVTRKQK